VSASRCAPTLSAAASIARSGRPLAAERSRRERCLRRRGQAVEAPSACRCGRRRSTRECRPAGRSCEGVRHLQHEAKLALVDLAMQAPARTADVDLDQAIQRWCRRHGRRFRRLHGVTGSNAGTIDAAIASGCSRRQLKSRLTLMPASRAIAESDAPRIRFRATSSRLNSGLYSRWVGRAGVTRSIVCMSDSCTWSQSRTVGRPSRAPRPIRRGPSGHACVPTSFDSISLA